MRIGWMADVPDLPGGAEHEALELLRTKPDWAEIIPCPTGDVYPHVDCYVVQNCHSYDARIIGALSKKPVIKRVHDIWTDGDPALRSWLLAKAKLLLFSSPLHRDTFRYPISAPVRYVPSAIDTAPFKRAAANRRRDGAVWIGRLYPGKGLHLAAQWAREQGVEIDVYGYGMLEDRLPAPLRYCGSLEALAVPGALAAYETFVFLPDGIEPYGRTAAEAWLAGCRLVLNENVGALWWIENIPAQIECATESFWSFVRRSVDE